MKKIIRSTLALAMVVAITASLSAGIAAAPTTKAAPTLTPIVVNSIGDIFESEANGVIKYGIVDLNLGSTTTVDAADTFVENGIIYTLDGSEPTLNVDPVLGAVQLVGTTSKKVDSVLDPTIEIKFGLFTADDKNAVLKAKSYVIYRELGTTYKVATNTTQTVNPVDFTLLRTLPWSVDIVQNKIKLNAHSTQARHNITEYGFAVATGGDLPVINANADGTGTATKGYKIGTGSGDPNGAFSATVNAVEGTKYALQPYAVYKVNGKHAVSYGKLQFVEYKRVPVKIGGYVGTPAAPTTTQLTNFVNIDTMGISYGYYIPAAPVVAGYTFTGCTLNGNPINIGAQVTTNESQLDLKYYYTQALAPTVSIASSTASGSGVINTGSSSNSSSSSTSSSSSSTSSTGVSTSTSTITTDGSVPNVKTGSSAVAAGAVAMLLLAAGTVVISKKNKK